MYIEKISSRYSDQGQLQMVADPTVNSIEKVNGSIEIMFKRNQNNFGVFIINFEPIQHFDLVLLLTLNT